MEHLLYAKCYTYLFSKIVSLPKRRHSLWDWIPIGHEPQAHEWILDNPEIFETMTLWSLCDRIPAKDLWEVRLLGHLAHSGTLLGWEQMAKGLQKCPSGRTVSLSRPKMDFCAVFSPLAHSAGSVPAPAPEKLCPARLVISQKQEKEEHKRERRERNIPN